MLLTLTFGILVHPAICFFNVYRVYRAHWLFRTAPQALNLTAASAALFFARWAARSFVNKVKLLKLPRFCGIGTGAVECILIVSFIRLSQACPKLCFGSLLVHPFLNVSSAPVSDNFVLARALAVVSCLHLRARPRL